MTRLQLIDVSKQYPGVKAVDAVSLSVEPGEIHALLGENGAGKSTLMKMVYGAVQPDSGQMLWNGVPVRVPSPDVARKLGIAMVFQHFSLFESLTVAENVWLGLDTQEALATISARIAKVAAEYGLDLEPGRPVHSLSVGEKQRVEIVRALLTDPKLLILDEPTSVLTPQAVRKLFNVFRRLSETGCSILYISHKLDEVRELCHRCTVLRAGCVVGEVVPSQESNASLSRLMIGSEPARAEPRSSCPGETLLEVSNLSLARNRELGTSLSNVKLAVRAGEIVGIAGISGNGQKELLAALSGEEPNTPKGCVWLMGKDVAGFSPAQRRSLGVRFVPEERLGRGAVPMLSLAANTLLTRREPLRAFGFFTPSRLTQMARNLIRCFGVKARGPNTSAKSLSGGNLQKFIVGREIDAGPKLLLLSQPTWGVDVGAAALIRGEVLKLRAQGVGVLLVSEELEELFELSDVLVVIAGGRVSPPIARGEASIEQVGEWMSGLFDQRSSAATSRANQEVRIA